MPRGRGVAGTARSGRRARSLARLAALLVSASTTGLAMPAAAGAQESPRSCPSGAAPRATLGITGLRCHCSFTTNAGSDVEQWSFRTEPVIIGVEESGVADGILREGDRIAAVDGELITTTAGGLRWGRIRPGETVALTIRRGTAALDVDVRAGAQCAGDAAKPRPSARSSEPNPPRRLLPSGWMGFGLACDCSVHAGGDFPRWTFRSPPRVSAVLPGGPAQRAGLRSGDRLLRIDGLPLDSPEGGLAFSRIAPGATVRYLVERDGRRLTIELLAEEVPAAPE